MIETLTEYQKEQQKNTWASHVPIHKTLIKHFGIQSILELGAGFYSTELFFDLVPDVLSIETDKEWIDHLNDNLKGTNSQSIIHAPIDENKYPIFKNRVIRGVRPHEVSQNFLDEMVQFVRDQNFKAEMMFVDCISSLRYEFLDKLHQDHKVVTFHDYNPSGLKNHWRDGRFKPHKDYYMFVDRTYAAHTGVLIHKDLNIEFIDDFKTEVESYTPGKIPRLMKVFDSI